MPSEQATIRKIRLYRRIALRKRKDGYRDEADAFDRVARMLDWSPIQAPHTLPWWWLADSHRSSIRYPRNPPDATKIKVLHEIEARP